MTQRLFPRVGRLSIMLAAAAMSLAAGQAVAQSSGLVPQDAAERHGLTRAWYAVVPIPNGRAKITSIVQDEGLLLVQTTAASLYAYDTESGRLVWSAEVGDPRLPSLPPGANGKPPAEKPGPVSIDKLLSKEPDLSDKALAARNDKVVAVINGATVYLLNRKDGEPFNDPKNNIPWKVTLRGAPAAGPLVTDNMVILPTRSGQIECYPTYDSKVSPQYMSSSGIDETTPIEVGDRITWASTRGVIHVTQPMSTIVRHRVETTGSIVAPVTAQDPLVFAGSVDGYLYCVNSATGDVLWKQTVGSPIRQSPAPIKSAVFAILEDGGLFRGGMGDGHQQWINPAAKFFLAASPTRIYAADEFGRLLIINAKTGATMESMTLPARTIPIFNNQTDRIYLSSESGLIQCLHEAQLEKPENYLSAKPEKAPEEPVKPKGRPAAAPADDSKKPEAKADDAADGDAAMPKAAAPEKKAPAPKSKK